MIFYNSDYRTSMHLLREKLGQTAVETPARWGEEGTKLISLSHCHMSCQVSHGGVKWEHRFVLYCMQPHIPKRMCSIAHSGARGTTLWYLSWIWPRNMGDILSTVKVEQLPSRATFPQQNCCSETWEMRENLIANCHNSSQSGPQNPLHARAGAGLRRTWIVARP